jgi:hypothetical protein
MASPAYIADRRLYLAADGRVVEARDPDKLTLLVPAGGSLPFEWARALGLIADPQPQPEPAADVTATPARVGGGGRRPAPRPRRRAGG